MAIKDQLRSSGPSQPISRQPTAAVQSNIATPQGQRRTGKTQVQQFEFSPEVRSMLEGAAGGLPGLTQALQGAAGGMFTQFAGLSPQLRTEFGGPQFGGELDAFSRNIMSQGTQALAQQAARQGAAARQRFGGGVGDVLAQQAQAQSRIQQNPLLFQAAQQQRAREAQEFQLAQQAQQLTNAARLAQSQAGIQGQQLQNQALLQQGLIPLQAQQNLLGNLGQFAQLTGRQTSFQEEENKPSIFNLGMLAGLPFGAVPALIGGAIGQNVGAPGA